MGDRTAPSGGMLPRLSDGVEPGDLTISFQDLPPRVIAPIQGFCDEKDIEIAAFFRSLWAVFVRVFSEADQVCFGCGDLRLTPEQKAKFKVIQTTFSTEITIAQLLEDENGEAATVLDNETAPPHNSALLLTQAIDKTEAMESVANVMGAYGVLILVEVDDASAPVNLSLWYHTSILSPRYAEHLASTVAKIIEEIIGCPERRIRDVDMFSQSNKSDVLNWNVRPCREPESLMGTISRHAKQRADHPAIHAWDGIVCYSELDSLVAKWAQHLHQRGIGRRAMVLVLMDRSKWAVIAEMAVLRVGAAFVPLDAAQPLERLNYIAHETGATLLLASERFVDLLSSHVDSTLVISDKTTKSLPEPHESSSYPSTPEDTAYVLFTSGSTGKPKGCVVSHGALANVVHHGVALKILPESRVLQFASYTFGVSLIEIYCTLARGATICIPSADDRINALDRAMNDMQITWAFLTPSTTTSIMGPVETLQTLVLAGEPMGLNHLHTWIDRVELLQGFGFTEWAGVCCVSRIGSERDMRLIGSSPTARLWLVDPTDHNRLAPIGAVAELVVDGPALAKEYLNNPKQTEASFLANPPWLRSMSSGGLTASRLYKTGDLVQYRADGTLKYVARKDTQVKIRGQRVELAEVEYHVRRACTQVQKVIVDAAPPADSKQGPILVTFLYSTQHEALLAGFPSQVAAIKAELETCLPDYMRPSVYYPLQSVPLTVSGKTDRRALRQLIQTSTLRDLQAHESPESIIVAPTTKITKQLHQLFAETLHLDPSTFGIHHSFIHLGGDSVTAMQLVNRARRAGYRLKAHEALKLETVARIAKHLNADDSGPSLDPVLVDTSPSCTPQSQLRLDDQQLHELVQQHLSSLGISGAQDVEAVLPCSPVQEGMLVSQNHDNTHYQMRFVWEIMARDRLQPMVNLPRLQSAWRSVRQRHSMLRTICLTNATSDQYAIQVVLRDTTLVEAAVIHDPLIDPSSILMRKEAIRQPGSPDVPQLTIFHVNNVKVWAVLNVNHTIVDAMSVSLIMRDLSFFYSGCTDQLAVTPAEYGAYLDYLSTLKIDAGLLFWERYLDGLEPCLFPLLNSSRQAASPPRLRSLPVNLGEDAVGYHAFCKNHGLTVASLFKLAWALVLRLYTGSSNVCFGYAPSFRDAPLLGIEDAVGPFINMLLCKVDMTQSSCSLLDILKDIQASSLHALEHRHVPLTEIRHHLHLAGEMMLNTGITFPARVRQPSDSSTAIAITEIERMDPTEYDIVLVVDAHDAEVTCTIKFDEHYLPDMHADSLADTLKQALRTIITEHHQCVSQAHLLGPIQQKQLERWNHEDPRDLKQCVHQLILERCRLSPDALAVDAWDGRWTYRELNDLSSRLAYHLQESNPGLGPQVFVPLCFTKSRWLPITVLAVMKTGAAFVLLEHSNPLERLQDICAQLQAPFMLSNKQCADLARQLGSKVMIVDDEDRSWALLATHESAPPVASHHPLYAVFTSGSTGTPKGVVVEHHSFAATATAVRDSTGFTAEDRMFQFSSYAFNVSVMEHLLSLLSGACLCIPSESDRKNRLIECANEREVTFAILTPTVLRLLDPHRVPTLKAIIVGGEHVRESEIQTWASNVRLYSMYGSAECSGVATWHRCTGQKSDDGMIGKALRSVATWVVDPQSADVLSPVGAVGELLLEGPGVSRGYLHARQIGVESPFLVQPPQWARHFRGEGAAAERRFYRTGDLVMYTTDGSLRFMGRKDTQVKISGQRVELGEIETAIEDFFAGTHQAVADVVTLAAEGTNQETSHPVLTAMLHDRSARFDKGVLSDGSLLIRGEKLPLTQATALLAHLELSLPRYMVPSMFIALRRVPLTRTGKIDRKCLRQAVQAVQIGDMDQYNAAATQCQPVTSQAEKDLQLLFAETCQMSRESISADSNFFLIGGDSLLAMKMIIAARRMGIQLAVENIMRNPRLADLAATIKYSNTDEPVLEPIPPFSLLSLSSLITVQKWAVSLCHLTPDTIEDIYPCTPMQEGMMGLSQKKPGMYVVRVPFDLPVDTDVPRLCRSWQMTVNSNATLRTRIMQTPDAGLYQVVATPGASEIEWPVYHGLDACIAEDAARPMGLEQPLLRLALIRHKDNSRVTNLVLTMHHAIYDGASVVSLLDQVESAYRGQRLDLTPFNYFIRHVTAQDSALQAAFWASEYEGLEASIFPPLPAAVQTPEPISTLETPVCVPLGPSRADATLTTVVRLAWGMLVSHYTNNRDVVFGVTLSGRTTSITALNQVSGPTLATVPFRVRIDGKKKVHDMLSDVQATATRILPFEQTGLQRIRKINQETASACDFQSLLVVQAPRTDGRNGKVMQLPESHQSSYDAFANDALMVVCDLPDIGASERTLNISASFDERILDPKQVQRMMGQFAHIIQQVHSEPGRLIGDIEGAGPSDMRQLQEWNGRLPPASPHTLHGLALRHARNRPHTLAVSSWDGELTYQMLDIVTAHLAAKLVELGVTSGMFVPLCFEKSAVPTAVMVAVLRAGGACANIDPALPLERVKEMLHQIRPTLVLASAAKRGSMITALGGRELVHVIPSLDSLIRTAETEPPRSADVPVSLNDPAFLQFTSGSTGTPKGIILEHVNLATSIEYNASKQGLGPSSRALHFASYSFDVSIYENFSTLALGGCVFVPSEERRISDIAGYIHENRLSWAMITPSLASTIRPSDVPSLETLALVGEAIPLEVAETWASKVRLVNAYGPCEATFCAAGDIPSGTWLPGTIGPMLGSVGWITRPDDPSRLAPVGAIGELLIEGPLVTRGYIDNPQKTKEAYIEAPEWLARFRDGKPSRLYRSGDLVQYVEDGFIRYIGRADTQIKIRGQRIELGEVEYFVSRVFPRARQVVADLVLPSEGSKQLLLAAFVLLPNEDQSEASGQSQGYILPAFEEFRVNISVALPRLQVSLPSAMIPVIYLPLASIPLTASGKTNRLLLRQLAQSLTWRDLEPYTGSQMACNRGPETPMQSKLHSVAVAVLDIPLDQLGVDDDLTLRGLDSIGAMRFVVALRQEGLCLAVTDIFAHRTLSALANIVESIHTDVEEIQEWKGGNGQGPVSSLVKGHSQNIMNDLKSQYAIHPNDVEIVLPTTQFQREWLSSSHHGYLALRLPASFDHERLQHALQAVVMKHSILRTVFVNLPGMTVLQLVHSRTQVQIQIIQDPNNDIEDICREDASSPVPYGGQYFRPILVRTSSGQDNTLILRLSHAQYDGLSLPILLRDISTYYSNDPSEVDIALSTQKTFADFVTRRAQMQTPAVFDFWRELLLGSSMTRLSPDTLGAAGHDMPEVSIFRKKMISMPTLPAGVTLATLHKAVWAIALSRMVSSHDIVFGEVVHGRSMPMKEVLDILGPCTNIIPVRVQITPGQTVQELLNHIQSQHFQTTEHSVADMDDIVQQSTSWPPGTGYGSVVQHQNVPLTYDLSLENHQMTATTYTYNFVPKVPYITSWPWNDKELEIGVWASNHSLDTATADRIVEEVGEMTKALALSLDRSVESFL
ncbi:putative nonribosomal peptide synthase [Aspergillus clavatus NRRL 1]|uniref:Nonribosomal peptide synthase, putative n=1 Tax=Aspergillus clavatus (strain ATCC 1007 / CBS 513.65 / DSM 816 / NCTC 3887 / NRRL 1 / QM 1276 / 107) TaxID=344612 RepID=A1C8B5_ASPCL|nr:nonribosomal peptide synthase, putative [Aspergillus clavatus NRRL 1]EAW14636.1 nonribosomal peptide synthase, putative [Aspergillus clavatus NRRL 1]